ncbi:MAG: hypothetical protein SFW62_07670 [Alphaproteobacteria bacterium]|nr:hypothetical protein [Alphaproteobacteria bacterium]
MRSLASTGGGEKETGAAGFAETPILKLVAGFFESVMRATTIEESSCAPQVKLTTSPLKPSGKDMDGPYAEEFCDVDCAIALDGTAPKTTPKLKAKGKKCLIALFIAVGLSNPFKY